MKKFSDYIEMIAEMDELKGKKYTILGQWANASIDSKNEILEVGVQKSLTELVHPNRLMDLDSKQLEKKLHSYFKKETIEKIIEKVLKKGWILE